MPTTLTKSRFEDILNNLHDAVFSLMEAGREDDASAVQKILDKYSDKQWTDFIYSPSDDSVASQEHLAKVQEFRDLDFHGATEMTAKNDSVMNPHNKDVDPKDRPGYQNYDTTNPPKNLMKEPPAGPKTKV